MTTHVWQTGFQFQVMTGQNRRFTVVFGQNDGVAFYMDGDFIWGK